MTDSEEWLRGVLHAGEGPDPAEVPDRLRPERLRRHAVAVRRRSAALGVVAVLAVAALGITQLDGIGLRRAAQVPAAPSVSVLVVPTPSAPMPAPTASPPAPTPATPSGTASPSAPATTSPSAAPSPTADPSPSATGQSVVVTGTSLEYYGALSRGAGGYHLVIAYRAPLGVAVSGTGPDGRGGGTENAVGGTGSFVAEFQAGRWTVRAVRLEQGRSRTVASTQVDVPPLSAWPRTDGLTSTTKKTACSTGTDADHRFAVAFGPGTATSATMTLSFPNYEKGQAATLTPPERTYTLTAGRLTRPLTTWTIPWPCDLKGWGSGTSGGAFIGSLTVRDGNGRTTTAAVTNAGAG